jgi:hypothetical protein
MIMKLSRIEKCVRNKYLKVKRYYLKVEKENISILFGNIEGRTRALKDDLEEI